MKLFYLLNLIFQYWSFLLSFSYLLAYLYPNSRRLNHQEEKFDNKKTFNNCFRVRFSCKLIKLKTFDSATLKKESFFFHYRNSDRRGVNEW